MFYLKLKKESDKKLDKTKDLWNQLFFDFTTDISDEILSDKSTSEQAALNELNS